MNKKTDKSNDKIGKLKKLSNLFLGSALITYVAISIIACIYHYYTDSSLNTASSEDVHNIFGSFGAFISDIILQLFGLSGIIFNLVFAFWGFNILRNRPVFDLSSKLFAFILGAISFAIFLGITEISTDWPSHAGIGGAIGKIALKHMEIILPKLTQYYSLTIFAIAILTLILSFSCFNFIADIEYSSWKKLVLFIYNKTIDIITGTYYCISDFIKYKYGKDPQGQVSIKSNRKDRKKQKKAAKKIEEKTAKKTDNSKKINEIKKVKEVKKDDKDGYSFPSLEILSLPDNYAVSNVSKEELEENAKELETVLDEFGIKGEIVKVSPGPVVTLYELDPAPGTKTSRVIGLADDIARSMSAVSVRIAVVPGKSTIGIEMPNTSRDIVFLREMLSDNKFIKKDSGLIITLGKDIGGDPIYADLAKMPHLLVAGTTGSGKSVGINSMILSLLYKMKPEECRMIMIDPKMLELSVYNGIPHLLTPVVTDPSKAVIALKWAVREMEDRYRAMAQLNVRNISGYNQKLAEARKKNKEIIRTVQTGFDPETGKPIYEEQNLDLTPIPYIVVIVDEMADLMLVAGKDVEAAIQRLAQMARAAGIHLIMATQRPSVDVITGTIKANFPTRISFQVTSKIDSRTILGEQGAEQLLGMGDMLYMASGQKPSRVHGCFVKDGEVEDVVAHLKEQSTPDYVANVTESKDFGDGGADLLGGGNGNSGDELYDKAVALILDDRKVSTSYIQRKLRIGYNRAASIVDRMEEEGLISAANHVGKREILVPDHN